MAVQIKVDISDVERQFGILREQMIPALTEGIAEGLFLMSRESFEQQRSPEGVAWAPLSPQYALLKAKLFPGKPILQRQGWLLRSLFRQAKGNVVTVGSHLPYAAIHQYGGAAGRGGKAQIPARPFLPSVETAEKEAVRLAEEILEDLLRRSEKAS